jgi:phage-related protein
MFGKHPDAKPLPGFGGAGILEIVKDHAGDTYRAVYRFAWRVANMSYMRFRRNQRAGSRRRAEIELIKSRLKRAEEEHIRRGDSPKLASRTS